jgi:hypothetical protein
MPELFPVPVYSGQFRHFSALKPTNRMRRWYGPTPLCVGRDGNIPYIVFGSGKARNVPENVSKDKLREQFIAFL